MTGGSSPTTPDEMPRPLVYTLIGLFALGITACDGASEDSVLSKLEVVDQFLVGDRLVVRSVATGRPGWIVVRHRGERDAGERDARVIGKAYIEAGERWKVAVPIEEGFPEVFASREVTRVQAALYYDAGIAGTFEEADPPATREGRPVEVSFRLYYTSSIPESYIVANDQEIEAGTVILEEVKMSEPGDVVIHRDKGNAPLVPGIIGKTALGAGVSQNVEVMIFDGEAVRCGEKLWPMLHVRTTSDDQPYDLDEPIVTVPLVNNCP